ncbi:MAG: aminoacyl-tRNA hydrolase [Bdellovibrionales bacterium]|nr:aminoacyl-tRNA hydrolase [Bdellovibrionales bacterium]
MNRINIPFSEFSFSFSRSGGAGGQNVNKVNSKAVLEWDVDKSNSLSYAVKERFKTKFKGFITEQGMVQITGQRFRSQKDNIDDCIHKLHEMLELVFEPPKTRKATKPKRSAVLNRLNTKKKDGEKKRMRKNDY